MPALSAVEPFRSDDEELSRLLLCHGLHVKHMHRTCDRPGTCPVHDGVSHLLLREKKDSLWGRAGFRVCEVGAGTGGLTRDAFPTLDVDNNCEILQYTATDISAVWAPRLLESINTTKLQFKARNPAA